MREELLDLLRRLVTIRRRLGATAFEEAVHRSKVEIARAALVAAERKGGKAGRNKP